jgi:hypothetical protein
MITFGVGTVISHPGVHVADCGSKELKEPTRGMVAGAGDHGRHSQAGCYRSTARESDFGTSVFMPDSLMLIALERGPELLTLPEFNAGPNAHGFGSSENFFVFRR